MPVKFLLIILVICTTKIAVGQYHFASAPLSNKAYYAFREQESKLISVDKKKLFQRNTGIILGLQKGTYTSIEMGGEAHWRKISFAKPRIIGATANMEYNFSSNIIGYKAGVWMKQGRINFTYGGNISYYNNFNDGYRWGIGPSIGFRLLGLHLINGFTVLSKPGGNSEKPVEVNALYMSLRYYVPVENKFTWDRKTMKKKRARAKLKDDKKKERERAKKDRLEEQNEDAPTGLKKLFNFRKKQPEPEPEKKGLKKLFNFKKKQPEPEPEPEKKGLKKLFNFKKKEQ